MLKLFTGFLTIVYFSFFFHIIQWIMDTFWGIHLVYDIFALVLMVIAFIASVGLACFTVRKIREL